MNKLVFIGMSLITPLAGKALPKELPHVILIMADDMGWGDVGFNGNKRIQTPHLDALASQGVIMDRFYSSGPLSSPTRASVLTGRNAFRTGVFSANVGILRKEETTIAELLKQEGYATGMFGKWHLGTLTRTETDANRGRPENGYLYNPPAWHGFDVSFVTESKVPTFDPMVMPVQNDERFWDYTHEGDSVAPYGTAYWKQNGTKVSGNLEGDDSRVIIDRVLPFIDESISKNEPSFSVIWFHAPHLPCVAGPEHVALYEDLPLEARNYYGCITALDEQVGRLVGFLKAKGIYNNCIILFCSDNGPEIDTPGTAAKFRGKKRSLYEGGIRVPSFICWPAMLPKGNRIAAPCSTSDYLPTLLDMTKSSTITDIQLDGESIWPLITGQTTKREKPLVFCSAYQGSVIDNEYKLYYAKGKYELYDIVQDPEEKKDISPAFQGKKEQLTTVLKQQMDDYKRSFESGSRESLAWQQWWDIWKQQ